MLAYACGLCAYQPTTLTMRLQKRFQNPPPQLCPHPLSLTHLQGSSQACQMRLRIQICWQTVHQQSCQRSLLRKPFWVQTWLQTSWGVQFSWWQTGSQQSCQRTPLKNLHDMCHLSLSPVCLNLRHIPFSSEQKPACPAVGVTNVACQSTFCSISNMCNLPNDERKE